MTTDTDLDLQDGEAARPSKAITQAPVAVVAAETVRVHLGAAMLGMTTGACNAARRDGRWVEGKHWHKSPDGSVWLDIPAIQEWVRTGR